jgi:hypothetical protein
MCIPICDFPFPKEKRLYKFKLNPNSIQLILQPLLLVGLACFNIFGSGVLANLCLVCLTSLKSMYMFQGLLSI